MSGLEELGRNIVFLRKALGLTQEQLALRSNLSVSRLHDIENGCRNITVDTLRNIAKALKIDGRVLGIFMYPDQVILSETYKTYPQLQIPEPSKGSLQIFDNIPLMRGVLGLTQKQLADSSSVSVSRLRDIEHGCANTTTNTLTDIVGAFDMTLNELDKVTMPKAELMAMVREARDQAEVSRVLIDRRRIL